MEVKLITANGKTAGQEIPVTGPRFFVGRAEDCQLRPRSDLVSRHHCVILVEEGFVAVRDFGSKNGTYVNGQRVAGEIELKSGDHLRIGTMELEVRIGVELKAKKKPKVRSVSEVASRTVQSAETAKGDADVSSWLDDDEADPLTETATMDPTRTIETVKPGKTAEPPAKPEPVDEEQDEPEDEPVDDEQDKPVASKGPSTAFQTTGARSKPASASSKDAAANMLKNFFRR